MKISKLLPLLSVILVAMVGCEEPQEKLEPQSVTLHVNETAQLQYSGDECVWMSDQSLIASVDNGLVTANLVGQTRVYANDLFCDVVVEPRYTMFKEPSCDWGATQEQVIESMSWSALVDRDESALYFSGDENVLAYTCNFENGKLAASIMTILNMGSNAEDVVNFLLERYLLFTYDDEVTLLISIDNKTVIGIMEQTPLIMIIYLQYPEESTMRSSSYDMTCYKEYCNKIIEKINIK